MKKFTFFLSVLLTAGVVMSSCSGDYPDGQTTDPGTRGVILEPEITPTGGALPLVSIFATNAGNNQVRIFWEIFCHCAVDIPAGPCYCNGNNPECPCDCPRIAGYEISGARYSEYEPTNWTVLYTGAGGTSNGVWTDTRSTKYYYSARAYSLSSSGVKSFGPRSMVIYTPPGGGTGGGGDTGVLEPEFPIKP